MIIDSHCHAWAYWPYQPPVPDPESRGSLSQLLNEMNLHGVDQAVIICAQIDHNPENNAYIAEQIQAHPGRLVMFADVDSSWSATYHQPGAAERLQQAAERYNLKGFTHYLRDDDDGAWLHADEGLAFFQVAAENNLIASISSRPHHQPALRHIAERFPDMPILCHHMGLALADPNRDGLKQVLDSAALPNIYVKVSGFAHNSPPGQKCEYPYGHMRWLVRVLYEYYGADRLCWGSDYPVVRFAMTYQQALEAFRTHCDFVSEEDQAAVLGGTMQRLLIST